MNNVEQNESLASGYFYFEANTNSNTRIFDTLTSPTSETTHIKLKMLYAANDVARRVVNVAHV